MTRFDGLLPPPPEAPLLPDRGGAPVIVRAARLRRRRRLGLAGTGTTVALAVVAMLANAPADRASLEERDPATAPATTSPAPSRDPDTAQSQSPAPPAGRVDLPPSGSRAGSGAPEPPATAGPTVPLPVPAPAPAHRWVEITQVVVPDRPSEPCGVQADTDEPNESVCVRYLGPVTARSGVPIDLVAEFCAQTVDIEVSFANSQEVRFRITSPEPGGWWWTGDSEPRPEPHRYTLERGTCARYTAHWDGIGPEGTPPPPGTYHVSGFLRDDGYMFQPELGPEITFTD